MSDCSVSDNKRITAVTVTYGERWRYLEVLLRCLEQEELVHDVVVIDNASKQDIAAACAEAGFRKAQVKRHVENLGSAGGYKAGIEAALTLDNDFIMLFDDDVVPGLDCIDLLQKTFINLAEKRRPDAFAIIPYRESQHAGVILEDKPLLLRKYAFQGLNVFNFIQRYLFYKGKPVDESNFQMMEQLGGAAYACLYFHRSLIDVIGLPDPEFVLYYDDVEFTSRILQKGGAIWFEVGAHCDDICRNYSMDVFSPPFLGYLRADNDAKIFYMMRNKTYLDCAVYKIDSLYYFINVFTLLIGIFILGILTRRIGRIKTIYRAVLAGYQGKMGMHPDFPLS